MTTFIHCQPQESALKFSRNAVGVSASVGPPDSVLNRQTRQHAELLRPRCSVEVVDLTGSSHQGAIQEPLPVCFILESAGRDLIQYRAQGVSGGHDGDDKGSGDNDDDSHYDSHTSELPSLAEIFAKVGEKEFRARFDLGPGAATSDLLVHDTNGVKSARDVHETRFNSKANATIRVLPRSSPGKHTRSPVPSSMHDRLLIAFQTIQSFLMTRC
jgi:hypothetical protein